IRTRRQLLGALEVWHDANATVFSSQSRMLLTTLAFLAAMIVENDQVQRTSLESERLRRDIEIASRIQQTLLLGTPPLDLQLLRAGALTIPSWQMDGDFYDFYAYDQVLDVIVGDVMGKGIAAALVGAATKNHFLRAVNYLLAADPSRLPEPRDVLGI